MIKDYLQTKGKIIKILGNSNFQVKCENGKIIIAHITSEFRSKRKKGRSAKIIEGSNVKVKISLNDLTKGSIIAFEED